MFSRFAWYLRVFVILVFSTISVVFVVFVFFGFGVLFGLFGFGLCCFGWLFLVVFGFMFAVGGLLDFVLVTGWLLV